MNVGLFGGSFNPPHVAHVLAVTWALSTTDLDRVFVIPAFKHPFGKPLAPYDDRVRMCERAMGWMPRVFVSRVEGELGGESRTLRTVEKLRADHPQWSLRLMVGADIMLEAEKWQHFDRIVALAPPLVLGRRGIAGPDLPEPLLPEVSSTAVRESILCGEPERVAHLVPSTVLAYIKAHALYASG